MVTRADSINHSQFVWKPLWDRSCASCVYTDTLCLHPSPFSSPPPPLLTLVNCSKTQAVSVETPMSNNKEAKSRIPQPDGPERAKEEERSHSDSLATMDAKVERFLKLGYSYSDILRVLESLRHDAQTNDILEELIKTCHTRTHNNRSVPNSPKLVPRGCSPSPSQARPGPDREAAAGFRPVVIDGSNVAMRWVSTWHSLYVCLCIKYSGRSPPVTVHYSNFILLHIRVTVSVRC